MGVEEGALDIVFETFCPLFVLAGGDTYGFVVTFFSARLAVIVCFPFGVTQDVCDCKGLTLKTKEEDFVCSRAFE